MEDRHNNTIIREFNRKAALLLAVLLPLVCGLGAWERYAQPKPPETLEEYMEENGTEPLSFSAESGFYEEDVVLEIDAAGLLPKEAKIHYTLDGEEPTQNSPVYKGPVRLTASGAVLPDGTEAGYNTRIEKDLRKYFGLKEKYLMSLSAGEGVTITWNNMLLAPGEEYTCPYYRGVQVCLSASVSPGWSFDHWEINGEPVENDQEGEEPDGAATLIVDGGSLQEKGCTVRAVSVPVEGELFIIDEVSSAGTDDWIRLYNAGTTRVDTGAYCLSDDPDNERMFRLPSTILEPGEYCVVTCSKNTSVDTEILCRCNFSLTRGETLCLTPDEGMDVPADSLRIPYMSAGCTYGRKKSGAIFRWFDKRGVHMQD